MAGGLFWLRVRIYGSWTQPSLALCPVKRAQACVPVWLASQDCHGHPVRRPRTEPRTVFAQQIWLREQNESRVRAFAQGPFPCMTLTFLVSRRSSPVKSHHEGRAGVSDPGCSFIPVWGGPGGMGGVSLSEGWGAAACTGPGLICCSCLEGPTEIEPPAAHGDLVCLPTPFPGGLRDDEAEAARGPRVSGGGCAAAI